MRRFAFDAIVGVGYVLLHARTDTAANRDHSNSMTGPCVLHQRTAAPNHLVVGMRSDDHDSAHSTGSFRSRRVTG